MSIGRWLGSGLSEATGSVILFVQGWNRRTRDEENHWLLHLFVCLAAMASYLAMALGQGSLLLADGREFFVARYVDWSITTPMLLLGLCLTALHTPLRRWALLLGILSLRDTQSLTTEQLRASEVPDHDLRPAPGPWHEVHAPGISEGASRG